MIVFYKAFKSRIQDSTLQVQRAFGTFLHHISLLFNSPARAPSSPLALIYLANPPFSHKGDNPLYGNLTYLHKLYLEKGLLEMPCTNLSLFCMIHDSQYASHWKQESSAIYLGAVLLGPQWVPHARKRH